MTHPSRTYARVHELTRGMLDIGEAVTAVSQSYLAEFAAAAAWSAVAVLERPESKSLEDALGELEDQALAVAETIAELSDQATRAALVRAVVASVRLLGAIMVP